MSKKSIQRAVGRCETDAYDHMNTFCELSAETTVSLTGMARYSHRALSVPAEVVFVKMR